MRNIYLVGFMGSGKTSVGKEIAKIKRLNFYDTDSLIELRERRTISDIFSENGEKYFRELEKNILKEISSKKNAVIACGGGIVMDEENIKIMKKTGVLIYLSASREKILKRISGSAHRPLLNVPEPEKEISSLMKQREKFYAKADIIINTSELSVKEVAEKILKELNEIIEIFRNRKI